MAAHQTPPSLGFSRQEHWSGLPFPSPMHESENESEVAQSCPTLPDPMDCSLPGSSVHGIFQERVLEWDAIAFSSQLANMLFSCFFISLIITEKEHLFMLLLVTFFFVWGLVSLCPLEFKNIIFKNSLHTEARNPLSYVF